MRRRDLAWPLVILAVALGLGALTVWERAAIVHVGAEVVALQGREARLEEEQRALRMALSRMTSPRELTRNAGKDAWVSQGGRTREVVERARAEPGR